MQNINTYHIEVEGQVDENSFKTSGPHHISVMRTDAAGTLLAVYADQSGLIGVLRHLHQHGFVIEAVSLIPQRRHA
jgi:hypothetical protein